MDALPEQGSRPSSAREPGPPPERDGPLGAAATRTLCPYLTIDGGGWRSAHPTRDHRCGALVPAAPLATDKQRRLCLTEAHRGCATFRAAREARGVVATSHPEMAGRPDEEPDGATVTRWSLVRTAPVVLDQHRIPVRLGPLDRERRAPQLMLGGALVVAFLALAVTRLSDPGAIATVDPTAPPSASPSSVVTPTPRPTARPSPSPLPSPTPTIVPSATPTIAPATSPPAASRTYVVRAGDTLYALAIRFGTTVQAIQQLNGLGTSSTLRIGQVLKIP